MNRKYLTKSILTSFRANIAQFNHKDLFEGILREDPLICRFASTDVAYFTVI